MRPEDTPPWAATAKRLRAGWQELRGPHYKRWEAAGLRAEQPIYDLLRQGAERFPQARMIFQSIDQQRSLGFAALLAEAESRAAGLEALGLRAGDVILVQTPRWSEAVVSFMAALRLQLVTVPVVAIYGPVEISHIAKRAGAKALVLSEDWRGQSLSERLAMMDFGDAPPHVISFGPRSSYPLWQELQGEVEAPLPQIGGDEVCALIYTSGTTSVPKGVLHTHNSLRAELLSNHQYMPKVEQPHFLNALLSGHIAGLLAILRPWVYGFDTLYLDRWDGKLAAELIRQHKIAWSTGAPFHLNSLLDGGLDGGNSALTSYLVGAASVPPALVERAHQRGVEALRAYGSTEHPTITASAPSDPVDQRAQTDGRAMPGTLIRIVDDHDRDLPHGHQGEILSMGPEIFLGYADPEHNAQAFDAEGWFRTGDIGVMGADGFLTIVDRKKDIIIRGGENISSREVEDISAGHPAIGDCAAVAVPDPALGERVGLCVRLRAGHDLSLAQLIAHFEAAGVARQKTPERLLIWQEDFPRTPSGKVVKPLLRKLVLERLEEAFDPIR